MKAKAVTLAALLVASHAWGAHAENLGGTLAKIKETGAVTLGYRESSIPFSFLDDHQKAVGYSIDLCNKVVEAIKAKLSLSTLEVRLVPVTGATRIPLLANGTVDLECGSTTNTVDRQKQIAFAVTEFIARTRFVSKKSAALATLEDLRGKTVAAASGTTNLLEIEEMNTKQKLGMTILSTKDLAEGFLMVETDRASAFFLDDVLLAGLIANSRNPELYEISRGALDIQPYGIMLRRDDPAFKEIVDHTLIEAYRSGEAIKLYKKWFLSPIPPRGVNLQLPASESLIKAFEKPTDSANPTDY